MRGDSIRALGNMKCMPAVEQSIVVIGKESVGKSQLISSLTGHMARSGNFRGTTVSCDVYRDDENTFIDTPGIMRESDSVTTRLALEQLCASERVLLVVKATRLDDDLADLLPLARGKQGLVAVTFWDKLDHTQSATSALDRLSESSGILFVPVDARRMGPQERGRLLLALTNPQPFPSHRLRERVGWRIEPRRTVLDHRLLGPVLALVLLLLPALLAVWTANTFASVIEPGVGAAVEPLAERIAGWPAFAGAILAGDYGFLTMGPLLFVWAAPTVVLYALFLGVYKASGLIERMTVALHPLLRPFGLSGRDLVRVIMGFGCNVPAVISTRSCSACSRGSCIAAIAFGAACSYQFGATLAVFSAAGRYWLVLPYLLFLTATTLVYTRMTVTPEARSPLNVLAVDGRNFLEWPRPGAVWREAWGTLRGFFLTAIPVFLMITIIASLLDFLGVIQRLAGALGPALALLNLPAEAALPVLLASIRKDAILLFAETDGLAGLTDVPLLSGVYLAGVLMPCLVTVLTIGREQSWVFVVRLLGRQMLMATMFAGLLACVGWWIF